MLLLCLFYFSCCLVALGSCFCCLFCFLWIHLSLVLGSSKFQINLLLLYISIQCQGHLFGKLISLLRNSIFRIFYLIDLKVSNSSVKIKQLLTKILFIFIYLDAYHLFLKFFRSPLIKYTSTLVKNQLWIYFTR